MTKLASILTFAWHLGLEKACASNNVIVYVCTTCSLTAWTKISSRMTYLSLQLKTVLQTP